MRKNLRTSNKTFNTPRALRSQASFIERLEPRTLLDSTPFPLLTDLNDVNDTVVRFQTNLGDIDIEMFDSVAPHTVANFLRYVKDGSYDNSFVHRKETGFVIQGGQGRLKPTGTGGFGVADIPTFPAIMNEHNLSNTIKTLAMARIGGQPNSATSQWFINLANNTNLDTVDGGFTVFARVANQASWDVVTTIAGLNIVNQGGQYGNLPISHGTTLPNPVTDNDLVTIRDAEIIKPQGVAAFYTVRTYYPEGFAGSTINEFIPLGNPGGGPVYYQAIVRSEMAQTQPAGNVDFWYRDRVVNTGSINANTRGGFTMSQFASPGTNLVDQGVPYAIEVWSTGPISASLSHYDFGSSTIEAFTTTTNMTWSFPDVRKGSHIKDFVVWQVVDQLPATVTLTFTIPGQSPVTIPFNTAAYRRGGIDISGHSEIPDGAMALQITSDKPIVAAITHYATTGVADGVTGGSTALGLSGNGSTLGVLPLGNEDAANQANDVISFFNPNSTAAVIMLTFSFSDGTPDEQITPGELFIMPMSRASFDLSQRAELDGKQFTIRYSSGSSAVFATTSHQEHADVASNTFGVSAATKHEFAEGFMDGARAGVNIFETLSLYNPNSMAFGAPDTIAHVTFRFLYTDGFVVTQTQDVAAGGRFDLDLHTDALILAQNANNRFFYSIEIVADIPILAMMRHYDLTQGSGSQPFGGGSTNGFQRGTIIALTALGGP